MKNRMVALFLTISLIVTFAIPASAKVIYGPGTAPTPSGPLYDSDGNTYYYNQPSYGGGNSTANAIASILGMIISGSQQQAQQKRQQAQQKIQQELQATLDAETNRLLLAIEKNCKKDAEIFLTILKEQGFRSGFQFACNAIRESGWECNLYYNNTVIYGRLRNDPKQEMGVTYNNQQNAVVVVRYVPRLDGNGGYIVHEQAKNYSKIRD